MKKWLLKYQSGFKIVAQASFLFFLGKGVVWIAVVLILNECS